LQARLAGVAGPIKEKIGGKTRRGSQLRCSAAQNRPPSSKLRPRSLLGSGWPASRSSEAA
jgi:hypothetical protein